MTPKAWLAALCLPFLMLPAAQAQSNTVPAASAGQMELAGRLSAMPQRLSKFYLQLRLNIDKDVSQVRLTESVRQFDTHLAALQRNRPEGKAGQNLDQLSAQWGKMRDKLEEAPSDQNAQSLSNDAEQIAQTAIALVAALSAQDTTPEARLSDQAQRNAMLAQRLGRLYMQAKAGNNSERPQQDMAQSRKDFLAGMDQLSKAPQNNNGIRINLELARQQFAFFDQAASNKGWDEVAVRTVSSTSERISQLMEDISSSYRRMGRASQLAVTR